MIGVCRRVQSLVHDVVDADYQRLQYLKMYLTPNVRSRISGLLSDPSTYQAALENLRNRYGNPLLIAQAATAKIARLAICDRWTSILAE